MTYVLATTVYDEYTVSEIALLAIVWGGLLALAVRPLKLVCAGSAVVAWMLSLAIAATLGRAAVAALVLMIVMSLVLENGAKSPTGCGRSTWCMSARWVPLIIGSFLSYCFPRHWFGMEFYVAVLSYIGADILSTHAGLRLGGTPRSLVSGRRLQRGESGGITLAGLAGGTIGAALPIYVWSMWHHKIALFRGRFDGPLVPLEVKFFLLIGLIGLLVDSILGASLQYRGRIPTTQALTEERYVGGQVTEYVRGVRWLSNEWVDVFSAVLAGATSILAYEVFL